MATMTAPPSGAYKIVDVPELYGALIKNEQDVHLLERLAFLSRRERG